MFSPDQFLTLYVPRTLFACWHLYVANFAGCLDVSKTCKKISNVSFETTIEKNTHFSALVDQFENLKNGNFISPVPPELVCTCVFSLKQFEMKHKYILHL